MKRPGFAPEVAAGLHIRDGGRCSMEGFAPCPGQTRQTEDPGHRLRRGMGGDSRWFVNDSMNGTAQHHSCNWRLGENAEFTEEGRRRGCVLEPNGDDDERTISTTPMWSPFFSQWVVLRPDGLHVTGITDPTLDARDAADWLPEEYR